MKKSILFAGLMMVAAMFIGCNKDHSPETSTSKLWPAATVSKNADGIEVEKWGYIDQKGNFVINAAYQEANEFSCGLALVRVSASSLFFIDEKNNMQSAPDFRAIYPYFYWDHVRYFTSSGLAGLLNKNFEIVIQPAYNGLGFMTGDGLIAFRQNAGDKCGYLDEKGEVAIPASYDYAYDFLDGYAVVVMGTSMGVINKKGEFTLSLQDKGIANQGAERIGFQDPDSRKYGLMDVNGKVIVQAIYDNYSTYGFTDSEYMAVCIDGKWGYIDKNGKQLLALQYNYAFPFMDGKAWIQRAEGSAIEFIDEKGKTLITLGADEVPEGTFRQGLCLIEKYNETDRTVVMKYINEKGATVYQWTVPNTNSYYYGGGEDYAPSAERGDKFSRALEHMMAPTQYGARVHGLDR